jgi:hypothetical protein
MAATVQAPPMSVKAVSPESETVPSGPKKLKPEMPGVVSREMTPVAAPPPLSAVASKSSVDAELQPGKAGAGTSAMDAAAGDRVEPAPAAKRQAQESAGGALQTRGAGTDKSPQVGAVERRKKDEFHGVTTAAAPIAQVGAYATNSVSAEMSERSISGISKKAGASALYKAKTAALPSGMIPECSETIQGLTVAVDAAGGVFLSEEAGGRWVSVTKQWSGRAVAVRLQIKTGASTGATAAAGEVFEIVNDQGLVWASPDGRIWKAK